MYVIRVMSGEEINAQRELKKKGYKVLCPRKVKLERNKDVERVIFTGYLFIDLVSITDRDYYKIKNSLFVIGFLDSKNSLTESDEKYIKLLDNDDTPIDKILVSFDERKKATIYFDDYSESISTKNVVRVNARSKTVTFKFKIDEIEKEVTFNYQEI